MENQLVKLSIANLSITDFDKNSLKDIIIIISTNSKKINLSHPFLTSNLVRGDFSSKKLSLAFSYKNKALGNAFIVLSQEEFCFEKTFKICSPDKQRSQRKPDDNDMRIIGQGTVFIDFLNGSIIPNMPDNIISKPPSDLNELALDLAALSRTNGSINTKQAEHFKILILGLNNKLKTLGILKEQLTDAEAQSLAVFQSRENLLKIIQAKCTSFTS